MTKAKDVKQTETVDEKSFLKAKIKFWENDLERFKKEVQESYNREVNAYQVRIAQLTELLYERFPEEKPPEPPEEETPKVQP